MATSAMKLKRWLFLGRKAITNLDCILKNRHYFADKSPSSQSYVFSSTHVWMWELDHKEGWALKNWCYWTVVWRRLLRVPWTARRSNHSLLKEINPEYSLEGVMLKLIFQYFGHLMWRAVSLEKTLMLEMTEGRRRRGWQRMRYLDGITDWVAMSLSKEMVTGSVHYSLRDHKESDMTDWTKNIPLQLEEILFQENFP